MHRTLLALLPLALVASPAQAVFVTPRLGAAVAIDGDGEALNFPLSAGFALQPSGSHWIAGFVSPQVDFEFPAQGDGVSYVPTLRVGILLRDEAPEYFSAIISWVQLYLIAGWRLPDGPGLPGTRLGIGIASPVGLLASFEALRAGLPLPNTFEFVVDGLEQPDPISVFRFGFSL